MLKAAAAIHLDSFFPLTFQLRAVNTGQETTNIVSVESSNFSNRSNRQSRQVGICASSSSQSILPFDVSAFDYPCKASDGIQSISGFHSTASPSIRHGQFSVDYFQIPSAIHKSPRDMSKERCLNG
jgi:hypothetical protein